MASPSFLPPAFWEEGDTQARLSVNDTFLRWWITQTNVNNATTAQPGSPADGDAYIIQSTHTGTQWATFTPKDLAIYFGGTWYAFAPSEGIRVSVSGVSYIYTSGTWTAAGGASSSGNVPQNSQSSAYTLVIGDLGKHIFHPSADTTARTWTIPANSSVAFAVGDCVTFVNQNGAGVITIAITTDTLRLAGTGATGSRSLAANGIATAIKVTSTEWLISGTGLT